MKIKNYRYGLIVLGIVGIIGLSYPLVNIYTKKNVDTFLSLSILNSEYQLGNYFIADNAMELNIPQEWNIFIKNIGESQYIKIKLKIIENKALLPNQGEFSPSPSTSLLEINRMVKNNITLPFTWEIQTSTDALGIMVNNRNLDLDFPLIPGQDYFTIFELWIYDSTLDDFIFKWDSRGEPQCIWNSIIFTIP